MDINNLANGEQAQHAMDGSRQIRIRTHPWLPIGNCQFATAMRQHVAVRGHACKIRLLHFALGCSILKQAALLGASSQGWCEGHLKSRCQWPQRWLSDNVKVSSHGVSSIQRSSTLRETQLRRSWIEFCKNMFVMKSAWP